MEDVSDVCMLANIGDVKTIDDVSEQLLIV